MDIKSIIPDIMPHYVHIGHYNISQSLIAGVIGTILFLLFVFLYKRSKKRSPYGKFVQTVEYAYETVYNFLADIAGEHVGYKAIMFATMIFFYVFWSNMIGLFGDMIVLVRPAGHDYFRPSTTDVSFNALLAVVAVVGSVAYGFHKHGGHFIARYFPLQGMGIVEKVDVWWKYITKFLDILLGLLIGMIELIGEVGRMMSLSLRLFGNMFVGMILLTLLIFATKSLMHYPILLPIVILAYEFCVAILQAGIFALLTTIYFKLSADHH